MLEAELGMELDAQEPHTSHGRPVGPLTQDDVRAAVSREIQEALGSVESQIAEERREAIEFYYGRPFGNEQEGRSQVILTDVADTIEWVMPQLMRMFFGGEKIARYEPRGEDDVKFAEEATSFVNKSFKDDMDGYTITHDLFKTALLEKNGFGKVFTETKMEPVLHNLRELDEEELMLLVSDESMEVLEWEEVGGPVVGHHPETGEPVRPPLYNVKARQITPKTRLRVDGIAPEEFLIARRAIRLDDETPFCAQRRKVSASDLISMGYPKDVVYNLPVDDSPEYELGRTERRSDEETFPVTTVDRPDPASQEYWIAECYILLDEDGDGYAERRKITVVGEHASVILDDEEVSHNPFFSLTPIPMPHKFFGRSLADLVMDLQMIRSTLLRQMLDNLYITNNQRTVVEEGAVEIDDLLVSRPGGVIRADHVEAVKALETQSFGPMPFHMLEFLEETRANRTGISRNTNGMDATSLSNTTATGVSMVMNAAQMRIELIARVFANTGLKRMFKLLLRELITGPFKKQRLRLAGDWVSVDPSEWNPDMDVQIQVGLGVGQAAERVANLRQIMEMQGELHSRGMGGYMVTPENVYNATAAMAEAMGFNAPGQFFTDPAGKPPPPPPPDPKLMQAELEQQLEPMRLKLEEQKVQIEGIQQAALADHRREQIESKERIERMRLESRERIELAKIQAEKETARAERAQRMNGSGEESHA